MIDKGFQFVTVQTDAAYLEAEARRVVRDIKQAAQGTDQAAKASGPY
jgi:hypothetical protein